MLVFFLFFYFIIVVHEKRTIRKRILRVEKNYRSGAVQLHRKFANNRFRCTSSRALYLRKLKEKGVIKRGSITCSCIQIKILYYFLDSSQNFIYCRAEWRFFFYKENISENNWKIGSPFWTRRELKWRVLFKHSSQVFTFCDYDENYRQRRLLILEFRPPSSHSSTSFAQYSKKWTFFRTVVRIHLAKW